MSTPERRLTPTERLHEVTLAALARTPAITESSVELSRNAKGDHQWSITVRGDDADSCEAIATAIDARLTALYPHSSTLAPSSAGAS